MSETTTSSGGNGGPTPSAPIGGVIRDPRAERVERPSLLRHWGRQIGRAIEAVLVFLGLKRRRAADGTLERRDWKRLGTTAGVTLGVIIIWTSVHIVQPGTVGVPVTLCHTGKPLKPGVHVTLPFTTTRSISTRVQNYTMSASPTEGGQADTSVAVLGADGGAAAVNATVLYRVTPARASDLYREVGPNYLPAVVRPSARACVRLVFTGYSLVNAATTDWTKVQDKVADCMRGKFEGRSLELVDFQMREVALSDKLQGAVDAKVAAQQNAERQKFELATALQAADISRIQALATADSQQILACGGQPGKVDRAGQATETVVPNPIAACSQSQLTPAYLQFSYIQALKNLVNSPNNSTIILPFDQNLTPLIDVGQGGTTVK
ncbi:MAG: prohibitin family protein [Actinomycetota bacterium]